MKLHGTRLFAALFAASLFSLVSPAGAVEPTRHIRGTVVEIKEGKASIKTNGGKTEEFSFGEKTRQFSVTAADIGAITKDRFVGVTSFERDGKRVAREVHIFAEALRGTGEGDRPWDLEDEGNHMTNATIGKVEAVGDDRMLKLDYKDGSQSIAIPPTAKIVLLDEAPRGLLKKDDKVFVRVRATEGGGQEAVLIIIGANGQAPPM
jgi:hypothetical protein